MTNNDWFAEQLASMGTVIPLKTQPAAAGELPEAVAWLRMKPDGTPDWAEDCIGSDDKFLDPEMASDGYYLQPLYTAPQQPAGVDAPEIDLEAIAWAYRKLLGFGCYSSEQGAMMGDRLNLMLLAAQQQGGA